MERRAGPLLPSPSPEGAPMADDCVRIIDTTIRDGQGSLWATSLRTAHMLPAMPHLDAAGFDAVEFLAPGSRLKKFVRHLAENPWDWIRLGAGAVRHTPLRWHGSIDGEVMSGRVPPEVGELLTRKVVELGITQTRTGNNWNNWTRLPEELKRYERLGMTPVISLMYSISPRHDDAYFVAKATELAALKPFRICFKDVSGLLTPDRARSLLPQLLAATEGATWEFHGHCNNGLGPLNALEAVKAGIRYIHTAVPPLANGNSQPSVYTFVDNVRALGYRVDLDAEELRPVTAHFTEVARREGFPIGIPNEYEERLYRHQIPGGMISNLRYQLRQAGLEHRIDEVLEETARVRAEFGYPIMVTPLSQIVGSQAAVNVITGSRYAQVTDAAIEYALGRHGGNEAISLMDPVVREKILDRPRAVELAPEPEPLPSLAELRRTYGPHTSDEDLILMSIVGDDAVEQVGRALDPRSHHWGNAPLLELIRNLVERQDRRYISISKGDLSVTVTKRVRA
ncbi:MAG: biotin carboxyl carrier protein [Blastococcus sp.]|jgi:oxaloacetate decarboxylase alpha subunit|nr:biotin carboxyl carrier protein [Blastococcus sp.]